ARDCNGARARPPVARVPPALGRVRDLGLPHPGLRGVAPDARAAPRRDRAHPHRPARPRTPRRRAPRRDRRGERPAAGGGYRQPCRPRGVPGGRRGASRRARPRPHPRRRRTRADPPRRRRDPAGRVLLPPARAGDGMRRVLPRIIPALLAALLAALFALTPALLAAQEAPAGVTATAAFRETTPTIGDRVVLSVRVEHPADVVVTVPLPEIEGAEVLNTGQTALTTQPDGMQVSETTFRYQLFTLGPVESGPV